MTAMNHRNQSGSVVLEFAIVLPLLVLVFGGMVDFGILLYNKQVITNATREGARAGIVRQLDPDGNKIIPEESHIKSIVTDYCNDRLLTFGETPSLEPPEVGDLTQEYPYNLTVTVTYTHTFLLSSLLTSVLKLFGGTGIDPTLEISAETVMRME
jgi:Flp pilus assembly protein TadG